MLRPVGKLSATLQTAKGHNFNYQVYLVDRSEEANTALAMVTRALLAELADRLCNCGYILPSVNALEPCDHRPTCRFVRAFYPPQTEVKSS